MEFPIYIKHPKGLWYSKLISEKECIHVMSNTLSNGSTIDYNKFIHCESVEHDRYVDGPDIQCTREEFMEAYNKAIETINSKL